MKTLIKLQFILVKSEVLSPHPGITLVKKNLAWIDFLFSFNDQTVISLFFPTTYTPWVFYQNQNRPFQQPEPQMIKHKKVPHTFCDCFRLKSSVEPNTKLKSLWWFQTARMPVFLCSSVQGLFMTHLLCLLNHNQAKKKAEKYEIHGYTEFWNRHKIQ